MERLLDSGDVFSEISVQRILEEAGVSRATFYAHFDRQVGPTGLRPQSGPLAVHVSGPPGTPSLRSAHSHSFRRRDVRGPLHEVAHHFAHTSRGHR